MSGANLDKQSLSGSSCRDISIQPVVCSSVLPTDRIIDDGQKLQLYHETCCFLTLKNPNNNLTKEELLRVLYSLRAIIGFSQFYYIWYEMGNQNQQHIHAIIKKSSRTLTSDNIKQWSKSFKLKKCKYLWYAHEPYENQLGGLIEYTIDTRCCNWKITRITDQLHLNTLIYDYRFKELDPSFLDT